MRSIPVGGGIREPGRSAGYIGARWYRVRVPQGPGFRGHSAFAYQSIFRIRFTRDYTQVIYNIMEGTTTCNDHYG